jgi:hypothetical protein
MKKLTTLLLVMTVMLLAWSSFALAQSQDSAKEEKPTFYRLIPGVYVNPWPRFTVTYPKDWVEEKPAFQEIFRISAPDPNQGERFVVTMVSNPLPLDTLGDRQVTNFKKIAQDVTLVSDKPSQLRDGTPAREIEIKMILNGLPLNYCTLGMKKGNLWVNMGVGSRSGRIREDLKAILYSLEFQPWKDEPVKLPPDVQEFLDRYCNDVVSHDVAKVITHYSDRFLNYGIRKGELERSFRGFIGSITSFKIGITEFVPAGDRAYLAGFYGDYPGNYMLLETSIIKENGEWKWYGNHRNPRAP